MTKRILIFVLTFLLVGSTAAIAANSTAVVSSITNASYATITIDQSGIGNSAWFTDKGILQTDSTPFIVDGRLFVPFRWATEVFGGSATWESRPGGTTSLVTLYAPPIKKEVATNTIVVPYPYPYALYNMITETVTITNTVYTPTVYETITNTITQTLTIVETATVYVPIPYPPLPPIVETVTVYVNVPTPTVPIFHLGAGTADLTDTITGAVVLFWGIAPTTNSTVVIYASPSALWSTDFDCFHEPYPYPAVQKIFVKSDANGYFSGSFMITPNATDYYGDNLGEWKAGAFQEPWTTTAEFAAACISIENFTVWGMTPHVRPIIRP